MCLWATLRRVESKLDKNDKVFQHSTKRAKKPREGSDNIVLLLRVGNHACSIGQVAREREQEEQQSEALARLFTVVLDDLRNPSAIPLVSLLSRAVTSGEWAETAG